ncbi:MAG: hypothetical protein AAF657_02220 [Acidobacteriota bacterium]
MPAVEAARAPSATWSLPTLVETRPRTGYHHPAGKAELAEILRFFGEEYVYGLRAVELRQADPGQTGLQLGRLVVPGQIVLYEQRPSPWHLPGHLGEDEARQLQAAGALLEPLEASTLVEWPGDTLRDFMRIDVLMHEVGHHLLQQHKGKRLARVARTRDHEAFADTLARRCRAIYQAHREQTE